MAITNPGDAVILESQAYGFAEGFLRTIEQFEDGEESSDRPHSLQVFDCPGDGEGLQPDKLLELLEGWPQGKPMPKLLYTVPTGSNPTGATLTEDRRRKVLKICHRFGIPILEDDPYYPIFYSDKPRPRSFFSLEKEVTGVSGLVIRSDSFSKILSSGMRLAFLSGPPAVVDAVVTYASNTNLQPPSTTQGIALKLLQHWGPEGLIAHCERCAFIFGSEKRAMRCVTHRVAAFYKRRRDVIEALAKESLSDIAEWTTPEVRLGSLGSANAMLTIWAGGHVRTLNFCILDDSEQLMLSSSSSSSKSLLATRSLSYAKRPSKQASSLRQVPCVASL